jgi:transposase
MSSKKKEKRYSDQMMPIFSLNILEVKPKLTLEALRHLKTAQEKFHELILSFPKSNAGFAVATRSETREALLEGLVTIFNFIGYVPSAIWFDQMSSAALRTRDEKGLVKVADFIMRFSTHYGFSVKFCNPDSGNEKGNVENKVGTIRRNLFVPEPTDHRP